MGKKKDPRSQVVQSAPLQRPSQRHEQLESNSPPFRHIGASAHPELWIGLFFLKYADGERQGAGTDRRPQDRPRSWRDARRLVKAGAYPLECSVGMR